METFQKIDKTVKAIFRWISYISAALTFIIAVMVTINILGLKIFNWSIPSCNDWVSYLFCGMFYFAIGFVRLDMGLVSVDTLTNHFPKKVNMAISVFSDIAGAVIFVLIGYFSISLLGKNYKYKLMSSTAAGHFPLWPFNLIVVIFSFLLAFTMIWHILETFLIQKEINIDDPKHEMSKEARTETVTRKQIEEDKAE